MNIIEKAIEKAAIAHRLQERKGSSIPYITHPYTVGMILMEAECSKEMIAAGILHDTIEDAGLTFEDIRREFGDKIAQIVDGCSEKNKDLPWEIRKRHTIEYLKDAPEDIKVVACADKLSNIRSMVFDYERIADEVWERFNAGEKQQKWYYTGLVESLCNMEYSVKKQKIFDEFRQEVERLFGEE